MEILHINLPAFIETIGYLGLFAVIFAESGLFFGFFLPGDSLLFTAGLLCSQAYFNIAFLLALLALAAILGDNVGYWFGAKVGPALFKKTDSLLFHKDHVEKTQKFYEKYGKRAVIFARFIPVVRTFAPILAGVGKMNYRTFVTYNIVGGLLWTLLLTLAGYFLGTTVPGIEKYIGYIIFSIIILSFVPVVYEIVKEKFSKKQ